MQYQRHAANDTKLVIAAIIDTTIAIKYKTAVVLFILFKFICFPQYTNLHVKQIYDYQ